MVRLILIIHLTDPLNCRYLMCFTYAVFIPSILSYLSPNCPFSFVHRSHLPSLYTITLVSQLSNAMVKRVLVKADFSRARPTMAIQHVTPANGIHSPHRCSMVKDAIQWQKQNCSPELISSIPVPYPSDSPPPPPPHIHPYHPFTPTPSPSPFTAILPSHPNPPSCPSPSSYTWTHTRSHTSSRSLPHSPQRVKRAVKSQTTSPSYIIPLPCPSRLPYCPVRHSCLMVKRAMDPGRVLGDFATLC